MNTTGFQPIHESNLKLGETYFLRTKRGEAIVKVSDLGGMNGVLVLIQNGGFKSPLKRYGKEDVMLVETGEGKFYEFKE